MKSVLLVACALGLGFLPGILDSSYATLFTLIIPILLGVIYFVLDRHDWPPSLAPWLFACVAVGRVAGYWWLNSRRGRIGPLIDKDVWFFGGLAAVCFALTLYKWMSKQSETPKSMGRSST